MAVNKKALYLLLGLVFVVSAIVFVSLRVSQQTSITPNAPVSKPQAGAARFCSEIGTGLDCIPGFIDSVDNEVIDSEFCLTNVTNQYAWCCDSGYEISYTNSLLKCVLKGNGSGSSGNGGGSSSGGGSGSGGGAGGGSNSNTNNNNGGACKEECPGSDGVLRNCTGAQEQSLCAWQGRKESCGGRDYCCPSANGTWTTSMAMCQPCTITGPTAMTTESISGTSQKLKWKNGTGGMTRLWVSKHTNPTSNCNGGDGDKSLCLVDDMKFENGEVEYVLINLSPNTKYYWRLMTWKESGCDAGTATFDFTTSNTTCTPTTWAPDPALTCTGTNVTQTSNCGTTRLTPGTKNCNQTCTPNGTVTCTPDCSTSCGQPSTTISTCKDSCGNAIAKQCSATASCCSDTTWLPDANLTCTDAKITQTSNCGATRTVDGTKNCCVESTWSPTNVSSTCSDRKVTQTSNCGTTREVSGSKTCFADLAVKTKTYADDARNKEGVYYTDKEITKISRGQVMVYTMEIKNNGEGGAKNVVVTDSLTGQNQNILSFIDSESKCEFNFTSKKLICKIESIPYKGAEKIKFRVRVGQTALNGKKIRNTVRAVYGNKSKEDSIETLVSSIVTCNETCTNDTECTAGLACDVLSGKCRKPTCISSATCSCVTASVTTTPTKTPTVTPSTSMSMLPDTGEDDATPTITTTTTPTKKVALVEEIDTGAEQEDGSLPASGIFGLPQVTVLGGGMILAIIGLFLAL